VFLSNASFEKRAQVPMEELIGGGQAAKAYGQFRAGLPGMEAAGEFFAQAARVRSGAGAQQVADLQRNLTGLKERAGTARPLEEQFVAEIREQFPEIMRQAGYEGLGGWLSRQSASLGAWASGDRLWDYERETWAKMGEFDPQTGRLRNEPGAEQSYETLREFRDTIREMRKLVESQQEVADKQLRAADTGPAMVNRGEDR